VEDDEIDDVVLRAVKGQGSVNVPAPAPTLSSADFVDKATPQFIVTADPSTHNAAGLIIHNTAAGPGAWIKGSFFAASASSVNAAHIKVDARSVAEIFDVMHPATNDRLIQASNIELAHMIADMRTNGVDSYGNWCSAPEQRLRYNALDDSWSWTFPSAAATRKKEPDLLAKIMRLYHASMTGDVRSPLVHIVGPAGSGKSRACAELAKAVGADLHVINLSRLSPLEIEGLQMPDKNHSELRMLTATFWTRIKPGDVVLFDEFLRAFPEQYNSILDILTSRQVGNFHIPDAFFIGASNSIATYDDALEDRLLHLHVPDPRHDAAEHTRIAKVIVDACGMHPSMVTHFNMDQLISTEIAPMYRLLDQFNGAANITRAQLKGHSPRNLIGQVKLREIQSSALKELIDSNNREAMRTAQYQYVILPTGENADKQYVSRARKLVGNDRLTPIQAQNLDLNLALVEMDEVLREIDVEEENHDGPLA
jgi:hypothetical protein